MSASPTRRKAETAPMADGPAGTPPARTPLQEWRARVADGHLNHDPAQALAAEKLTGLHQAIRGYEPGRAGSWLSRFGLANRKTPEPPRGLYLYGGVGRGKSMLMDLFFDAAPVARKRRVHFHEFMLEIQDRLHKRRGESQKRGAGRRPAARSRRRHRRGRLAALLRRAARRQHRRRHDPRPPVRGPVRPRRDYGRDLQLAARPALRGRPAAPALPALHRPAQDEGWTCCTWRRRGTTGSPG